MTWQFVRQPKNAVDYGITQRDDFSNENVGLEETIVRESVQNSLDAHTGTIKPVRVTFRWYSESDGLDSDYMGLLLKDQLPHAQASGIDTRSVLKGEARALLVEDFNTTGLLGATDKKDEEDFTSFWRNHGRSRKQGEKRGRWGLGKLVFSQTSQLGVFFGLTKRDGDAVSHLMGQSVLDLRELNGKSYPPHAIFGDLTREKDPMDQLQIPIRNPDFVKTFEEKFSLNRGQEPGLSLVIPYPDADFIASRMIGFSIKSYFFPLITGHLQLQFHDQTLDDQNVRQLAKQYAFGAFKEIDPLFDFIEGVFHFEPNNLIKLKPSWSDDSKLNEQDFNEEDLESIKKLFADGNLVGLELPITLTKKGGVQKETHFRVYIQRPEDLQFGVDLYVRGGLTVPQEAKFKHRKALGAMIAEDKEICSFLGDAENPSHTKWSTTAEKLRKNWSNPQKIMRSIRQSVVGLYDMLAEETEEVDTTALSSFFPDPKAAENKKRKKKKTVKTKLRPIKQKTPDLRVTAMSGGFKVQNPAKNENAEFPYLVNIFTAYDVVRGNSFTKYNKADFDLKGNDSITIDTSGACNVELRDGNQISLRVTGPEFELVTIGFDINRDLKIRTIRRTLQDAEDV